MSAWKKITKEIDRQVLATNNRKGRYANGEKSHVWIVTAIHKSRKYKFCGFDGDTLVMNLTHYAEIPE